MSRLLFSICCKKLQTCVNSINTDISKHRQIAKRKNIHLKQMAKTECWEKMPFVNN